MPVRTAHVTWADSEQRGGGRIETESGTIKADYSWDARFESAPGTNPEELLGASLASCFTIAVSARLRQLGKVPERMETTASVHLDREESGYRISRINLDLVAHSEALEPEEFQQVAHEAKLSCPLSKALAGTDIFLDARLVSG